VPDRIPRLLASAATAIALAGLCAGAGTQVADAKTRSCARFIASDGVGFGVAVHRLRATRVSCATAKRVARGFVRQDLPAGWTCAQTPWISCARGQRRVTFAVESTS